MLDWFFAACILLTLALFWAASLFFAPGGPLPMPPMRPAALAGRRISGCRTRGPRRGDGRGPVIAVAMGEAEEEGGGATLICKPSALARYLQRHCVAMGGGGGLPAAPRWSWRASPFLQTVAAACWPAGGAVRFVRDHLQLADGGLVALDWAAPVTAGGTEGSRQNRRRTASDATGPVLLVVPNSFGKITWNVLKLCDLALSCGYTPVVFNRRGQNGALLATPRLQRFGDPADLREAMRYLRHRRPGARFYAASEGTGAGLLLAYLGECGSSSYLTAAACLSPVLRCQAWYESAPRWPYSWALLLYQKICLSRYRTALGETIRMDAVFSCSSLRSMEEALFCQPKPQPKAARGVEGAEGGAGGNSEGGVSWEEYWEGNEPLRDVDEVAVPVLCVCSRDDPVRGDAGTTLPFDLFRSNPHLFLLLTEQGGHCGFAQRGAGAEGGVMGAAPWSHRALLEYFRGVTDFFAAEERAQAASLRRSLRGGAVGAGVAAGNSRGFRPGGVGACKRLPACSHSIHSIYSWQRSYTR